jgi:hypothetical protein
MTSCVPSLPAVTGFVGQRSIQAAAGAGAATGAVRRFWSVWSGAGVIMSSASIRRSRAVRSCIFKSLSMATPARRVTSFLMRFTRDRNRVSRLNRPWERFGIELSFLGV